CNSSDAIDHDRSLALKIAQTLHELPSQAAVVSREGPGRVEVDARVATLSSPIEDRAHKISAHAGTPSSRVDEELSKPWCQFRAGREIRSHEVRGAEQLSLRDRDENRRDRSAGRRLGEKRDVAVKAVRTSKRAPLIVVPARQHG